MQPAQLPLKDHAPTQPSFQGEVQRSLSQKTVADVKKNFRSYELSTAWFSLHSIPGRLIAEDWGSLQQDGFSNAAAEKGRMWGKIFGQ